LPEQLTIWPDDEFDSLSGNKKLQLLKNIDISRFIPYKVRLQYYKDTGRPPYSIESMLLALIAQRIIKMHRFCTNMQ